MRIDYILITKYRIIGSHIGFVLFLIGLLTLTPLLILFFFPEELHFSMAFIAPAVLLMASGGLLYRWFRDVRSQPLLTHEAGIIVLFAWISAFIFSAFPFMKVLSLSFPLALFESVSAWTTTGLSVVDVTGAPRIILLWRSIMQLAGGAGFAIMMIAALTGVAGAGLSEAEGRSDQLIPQVRRSAQMVLLIYTAYLVFGVSAYILVGMSLFDAVNHTFSAISTGGFSTHVESVGFWDSAKIEGITIILMILGNLNFVSAYLLIRFRFRSFFRNGEIRIFAVLIILASLILFFSTATSLYPLLSKSIRVSIFEITSALTTTGFSTVSYTPWNDCGIIVLIILMLIGGGTCSTAGGIKQYRVYLLLKAIGWEIHRMLSPANAISQPYIRESDRKTYISDRQIKTVSLFFFIYIMVYLCGSLVLSTTGIPLREAFFEFASALGTVGLSVGVTSVNMSPVVLWTEITGMFLGRLEFFIIIVSIVKLSKDIPKSSR
ncbi:MAG: TrkH family potassium uptake protein [Candidatus Marinimicrobia bacterium]|nr:TrkH family potassium uptake protein [Candidatus Neomarinimicrobiota bacterium]